MKKVLQALLLLFAVIGALCAFAACENAENGLPTPHRHILAHYTERASTCYYKGTKDHWKCTGCSKLFLDAEATQEVTAEELEIDFLPHTETIDEAEKETCFDNGKTEGRHCMICHAITLPQEIVPAEHKHIVTDARVEPTCTKSGLTEGKHCSVCHTVLVKQEIIPAEHTHIVTDARVEPTCTKSGLTEGKHCSVCHTVLVKQEVIPVAGHTEVVDKAVAPSCTENGLTAGKHCSVCNIVLVEQEIVPARHKWNEENICSVCGLTWNATAGLQFALNAGGNSYSVSGIGTASGNVVIPNIHEGKSVTDISAGAFKNCSNLTGITIPENISSIGGSAFEDCDGLISVTIPGSVISIGVSAFLNCNKLTKVVIENGVISIGNNAFENCSDLTNVTIPDSVISIGTNTFYGCSRLIRLENGVQYVDKWAVGYNDKSGLTSVKLRSDTVGIASGSFFDCIRLTSVTIPKSVRSIRGTAFAACMNLTIIVFDGTRAEWNAIKWKDGLEGVSVGEYTVQCTDGKLDKEGNEIV